MCVGVFACAKYYKLIKPLGSTEEIHASEAPRNHKVSWTLFEAITLYLALATSGLQGWSVADYQSERHKTKHSSTMCTSWAKVPDPLLHFRVRER